MLIIWLCLAGVLIIAEMLTLTLYTAPFAVGALVAAGLDALDFSLPIQLLAFAIVGALMVAALRPVARRHQAAPAVTGPAALKGKQGIALTEINERDGRVKAGGGEWSAKSESVIAADQDVEILDIEGATLIVKEKT